MKPPQRKPTDSASADDPEHFLPVFQRRAQQRWVLMTNDYSDYSVYGGSTTLDAYYMRDDRHGHGTPEFTDNPEEATGYPTEADASADTERIERAMAVQYQRPVDEYRGLLRPVLAPKRVRGWVVLDKSKEPTVYLAPSDAWVEDVAKAQIFTRDEAQERTWALWSAYESAHGKQGCPFYFKAIEDVTEAVEDEDDPDQYTSQGQMAQRWVVACHVWEKTVYMTRPPHGGFCPTGEWSEDVGKATKYLSKEEAQGHAQGAAGAHARQWRHSAYDKFTAEPVPYLDTSLRRYSPALKKGWLLVKKKQDDPADPPQYLTTQSDGGAWSLDKNDALVMDHHDTAVMYGHRLVGGSYSKWGRWHVEPVVPLGEAQDPEVDRLLQQLKSGYLVVNTAHGNPLYLQDQNPSFGRWTDQRDAAKVFADRGAADQAKTYYAAKCVLPMQVEVVPVLMPIGEAEDEAEDFMARRAPRKGFVIVRDYGEPLLYYREAHQFTPDLLKAWLFTDLEMAHHFVEHLEFFGATHLKIKPLMQFKEAVENDEADDFLQRHKGWVKSLTPVYGLIYNDRVWYTANEWDMWTLRPEEAFRTIDYADIKARMRKMAYHLPVPANLEIRHLTPVLREGVEDEADDFLNRREIFYVFQDTSSHLYLQLDQLPLEFDTPLCGKSDPINRVWHWVDTPLKATRFRAKDTPPWEQRFYRHYGLHNTVVPKMVIESEGADDADDFLARHSPRGWQVVSRFGKYLKTRGLTREEIRSVGVPTLNGLTVDWVPYANDGTLFSDKCEADVWADWAKVKVPTYRVRTVLVTEALPEDVAQPDPDEGEVDAAITAYRTSPDTAKHGVHRGDRVLFAYGGLRSDPPEAREWKPGTVVNVSSNKALVWVHPDDEEPDVTYYKEASELKKLRESKEHEQDDPEGLLPGYQKQLERRWGQREAYPQVQQLDEFQGWDDRYFDFEATVIVGRLPNGEVGGDNYGWRITLEAKGDDAEGDPCGPWVIWGGPLADTAQSSWDINAPIPPEHLPALEAAVRSFLIRLFGLLPGLRVTPQKNEWSDISKYMPPYTLRESTEEEQDDPEGLLSDYAPKLASAMGRELVVKYGLTNSGVENPITFDGYSAGVNQHSVEFSFTMRVRDKEGANELAKEIEDYFRSKFKGGWSLFVGKRSEGVWETAVWVPRSRLRVDKKSEQLHFQGNVGPPQPA